METQDLLQDIEQEIVLEHAGVGQRFANYLIDILCIYALVIAFGIVASVLSGSVIFQEGSFGIYVTLYSTLILYYTVIEGLSKGRTVGKLITRTKVVKEDGSAISFGDAFRRSFSRIVPFEAFSAFGGHPWHDRWTQTYVVKK